MVGCTVCGRDLDPRNVTGFCRRCHSEVRNRDPEYRAKVVAGEKRRLQLDPEARAKKRAIMIANRNVPGADEKRKAAIAASRVYALAAANAVNVAGSAGRVLAGVKRTATVLAWCPPHLRGEYRYLYRVKRIPAAEARQMIEDQNEMEMARWRRSLGITPVVVPEEPVEAEPVEPEIDPADVVIELAAKLFGVTVDDIMGSCRQPRFTAPRYAVAVAMHRQNIDLTAIAVALGKSDHTTSLHWRRRGEQIEAEDAKFACKVARLSACWVKPEAMAA